MPVNFDYFVIKVSFKIPSFFTAAHEGFWLNYSLSSLLLIYPY